MKVQRIPNELIYVFLFTALALIVVGIFTWDWKWFIRAFIFAVASLFLVYLNKVKK